MRYVNTHYKAVNAEPIPPFAALTAAGHRYQEVNEWAICKALVRKAGFEPATFGTYESHALAN